MATLLPRAAALAGQLWRERSLVLVAEPGAGKTTLLPPALLAHPEAPPGQIWVLEPRRLAARLAATYVAAAAKGPVGGRVGYRVRFDDATSADTRLVYMTDGMLQQRLTRDPTLQGVACVLFDEFHGRSLAQDAGLAALCALRAQGRLRAAIGVMSATLEHERVAAVLGGCTPAFVSGRTYPVDVHHLPARAGPDLAREVARALAQVLAQPLDAADAAGGGVLVFLPGARAIEKALQATASLAARHRLRCLPLHASLPPAEQQRPFAPDPAGRRTVVFATNVAETSLTLPGVRWVIDAGLAKQARQLPLSGITQLVEGPISQASAVQRAGRAGRVAPGACLRLYTAADWRRRPAFDVPEVARLDLAETLLFFAHVGLGPVQSLPFVDPVPPAAQAGAEELLRQLGALDASGAITAQGRRLAALPVHPRLGRMLLEAERLGVVEAASEVATALAEDLAPLPGGRPDAAHGANGDLSLLRRLVHAAPHARRVAQGLRRALAAGRGSRAHSPRPLDPDAALAAAARAGFADRVGRRLPPLGPRPGELALAMARGGPALLAAGSQARGHPFVVALRAEVRGGGVAAPGPVRPHVRWAVDLSAEALLEAGEPWVRADEASSFDAGRDRVMRHERLTYDGLTLLEEVRPETDPTRALPALREAFWRGPGALPAFTAACEALAVRLRLAAQLAPEQGLGPQDAVADEVRTAVDAALGAWLQNGASLRALDAEALLAAARAALPPACIRALHTWTPDHVVLPHGKRLAITYGEGAPPFVESYLQDFFGAATGPAVAGGRLPLVVHLWGPNRRALQVTKDLAGFWREHYPKLRPALARRYPRHAWPEDPASARPPVRPHRSR